MKIDIIKEQYLKLVKKIENLNKKLAKHGQSIKIISENHYLGKKVVLFAGVKELIQESRIKIEINVPEITGYPNVEYLGVASKKNDIWQTYSENNNYVLSTEKKRCDHCAISRYRVKYFYFLQDGKVVSIGSSCVKHYFGINAEKVLSIFSSLNDYVVDLESEEKELGPKVYGEYYISLLPYITAIVGTSNGGCWISTKNKEYGESSSTDIIKHYYSLAMDNKLQEEIGKAKNTHDKDFGEKILDKIVKKYKKLSAETDFEYNIKSALFIDGETRLTTTTPGIIAYLMHQEIFGIEKKENININYNEGEKIEIKIEISKCIEIDGDYGKTLLVIGETKLFPVKFYFSGKNFDQWKISEGEEIIVKSTVKKIYNDYVLLTRAKKCK